MNYLPQPKCEQCFYYPKCMVRFYCMSLDFCNFKEKEETKNV